MLNPKNEWGGRDTKILALSLSAVALMVVTLCCWLVLQLKATMAEETGRYLGEISGHVAHQVNLSVETTIRDLRSMGETYLLLNEAERVGFLRDKARSRDFTWLAVVWPDGYGYTTGGQIVPLLEHQCVVDALAGEECLSGRVELPVTGEAGVMFAVPLKHQDEVIGALTGWKTLDQMRERFNITSFGDEGFCQIVSQNGDFIVDSHNKNAMRGPTNVFEDIPKYGQVISGSLEQMRADMENGRRGALEFTLDDGVDKVMDYVPLEVGNWYLLSVVPVSVATEGRVLSVRRAILANVIVVALFLLLICLLMRLNRGYNRRISAIAFVDPVTGGDSKARFDLLAAEAIRLAPAGTYQLVSLDVQQFKLINDSFGGDEGDRTLRYIHDVLRRHLLPGEHLSRVAEDNFNILVLNQSREALLGKLDLVSREINRFNDQLEHKYYLYLVAGVYRILDPNQSLISIQDRANAARQKSKVLPSQRFYSCTFYSDLDRIHMLREKEMENRMDEALRGGEFLVYLQPKVELEGETIAGAEALVRWRDPDKGLIPPNEFIPFFERNGFIVRLDLYVFEETCRLLRKWLDRGLSPMPVSVNLSRVHLMDPDFLKKYQAIQQQYRIPPRLLEIELTETVVFENLELLCEIIDRIHAIGFQTSLDDFGSGYSSLNVLKDVHVDIIKLDGAFWDSREDDNPRERSIIRAVVSLAKELGMRTVSEGVETQGQLEFLRRVGCDMVQGYVFSRPLPPEEFEKLAFGAACLEGDMPR